MPKQKRWALKRLLDQACEDIERAQSHLADVYIELQPVHPGLAQYLSDIGVALNGIDKLIERFKDEEI